MNTMHALFLILNDVYLVEDVHEIFYEEEVGATTIDSRGMGKVLLDNQLDIPIFTSMKKILEGDKPYNKMVISVIRSDEKLERIMNKLESDELIKKGTGFLFVVPVSHCRGYKVEEK